MEESQPQLVLPLILVGEGRGGRWLVGGRTERRGSEESLCHFKQVGEVVLTGWLSFLVGSHQSVVGGSGGGGGAGG